MLYGIIGKNDWYRHWWDKDNDQVLCDADLGPMVPACLHMGETTTCPQCRREWITEYK